MFKFIRRIVYLLLLINILGVVVGKYANPPITMTQIGGFFEYGRLKRNYIPLSEMGENVQKAVLASEDQKFFTHSGFDYDAIEKAYKDNQSGKKIKGGSTISQQTAKNIFLWQKRSWLRKSLEAFYTFVIEKAWGKEVILERYLNSIEMGQGVFGVEAAAEYYFGKSAKNLTKSEAAWVATVLPNPKVYDPKKPTPYLKKKHNWVMQQMNNVKLKY